ncbi:MAG: hypothetical protein ACOH1Y_12065 [Propionicimonas sp.]
MSKARVWVVALAATGLLALAGCGGNPQVAAYVGGPTSPIDVDVSQAEVDTIAKAIADSTSDAYDTAVTFTAPVMQILVQSAIVQQVAKDLKITVTDAQRETFYATAELYPALVKNPATHDFMVGFADANAILADKAVGPTYAALVAKTSIRVNPRYGTWDAKAGGLVEGSSGSLSEAAPIKQG